MTEKKSKGLKGILPEKAEKKAGAGSANAKLILQRGAFSLITSLILLATLIFVNLSVSNLPSEWTQRDISSTGLYQLSDQTLEVLSRIQQETDIYWIVQSGQENSEIRTLLSRYQDQNPLIRVEEVDPVVNPNFTDRYTNEIILDNSLIVAGGNRSRYISYNDIFTSSYNYYTQDGSTVYFDGENKITSAIDYVNEGKLPTLYRVTGHGEAVLSIAFEEALARQNYQLKDLNTLGLEQLPEDADCLMLVGPTADLTEKEGNMISEYLASGGRLLAFTDYEHTDLPVLMGLLEHYGVEVYDGLVLESDPNMCYGNYPMQLLPGIIGHDITLPITRSGYLVLVPMAHAMKVPETFPTGVNVSALLTTSAGAYAREGRITSLQREEGDEAGPFAPGIAAEERLTEGKNRIVWFSTSQIINKEYDAIVNGINTDLVLNSLGWLTENDSSITIRSKQISAAKLAVPSAAVTRIGIVLVGVIPLLYLLIGAVIMLRRRKK